MNVYRIKFTVLAVLVFTGCYFYSSLVSSSPIVDGERRLVVVIPSYNNKDWYERNLGSVFAQNYSNYNVIYCDDCSPDGTGDLVRDYIKKNNQEHRCTVISNPERKGTLYNLYQSIHMADDRDIVIDLDGDDWLNGTDVFSTINKAYGDKNVWLTYGQYQTFPGNHLGICKPMPQELIANKAYRKQRFFASHLRTFYAGLFKRIQKDDFLIEGQFYPATSDVAFMMPLLEMANGHLKFIDKIMYIYNEATPLNDYKLRFQLQAHCERMIRNQQSYEPLSDVQAQELFLTS